MTVQKCEPAEGAASGTWHWVRRASWPPERKIACEWDGSAWMFNIGSPFARRTAPLELAFYGFRYLRPVLTPDAEDALRARVAALEAENRRLREALRQIEGDGSLRWSLPPGPGHFATIARAVLAGNPRETEGGEKV